MEILKKSINGTILVGPIMEFQKNHLEKIFLKFSQKALKLLETKTLEGLSIIAQLESVEQELSLV